jgi:hypothetical protein
LSSNIQKSKAILAAHGLSSAESALLNAVHYCTHVPAHLPNYAQGKHYSFDEPVSEDECAAALPGCFAKGWFRIVGEVSHREIAVTLRRDGVLGPVFGLPPVGQVDFTPQGAALWQRLVDEWWEGKDRSGYHCSMTRQGKRALFCRNLAGAVRERDRLRHPRTSAAVSQPRPIGPWRVQWWRRYEQGYRLDIDSRTCGDTFFRLNRPARCRPIDPARLRRVLAGRGATFGEWVILSSLDRRYGLRGPRWVADRARAAEKMHGIAITEQECRAAQAGCLLKGWAQTVDRKALDAIHALLRADPAFMPLGSRTAGQVGEIDFTVCGAELYQAISAEYFGPCWDAEIYVERTSSWCELIFSETEEGIHKMLHPHAGPGPQILWVRTRSIGPWCSRWWQRFPGGYRVECEKGLAEP